MFYQADRVWHKEFFNLQQSPDTLLWYCVGNVGDGQPEFFWGSDRSQAVKYTSVEDVLNAARGLNLTTIFVCRELESYYKVELHKPFDCLGK